MKRSYSYGRPCTGAPPIITRGLEGMKTTIMVRDALKEMAAAGAIAIKGQLLLNLLEDIDMLIADYDLLVSEHEKTEKELAAALIAPDNAD